MMKRNDPHMNATLPIKPKSKASKKYGAKVQVYLLKDGSKSFSAVYRGKWSSVGNSKKGASEKKAFLRYLEMEDEATNSVHGLQSAKHLTFDALAMSMFRAKRANKKTTDHDIKNYENHIKPVLGGLVVSKITEDDFYDLQEYLDEKINARGYKFALGSKQLYLNIAKSIVHFGAKKKLMNGAVFKDICFEGTPKSRKRYFNKSEVKELLRLAEPFPIASVLIKWYLYTGLRAEAALNIQLKDFD